MTTHEDRPPVSGGAAPQQYAAPAPVVPATGPGNAFPATATGVPLSVFAFGFSIGILGLVDTGILSGRATGLFVAVAIGTGALGLFVGGLWDFRGGNLFAGTFGVAYALFLFTTGLILRFFAAGVIVAAGANASSGPPLSLPDCQPGRLRAASYNADERHRPGSTPSHTAQLLTGPLPESLSLRSPQ